MLLFFKLISLSKAIINSTSKQQLAPLAPITKNAQLTQVPSFRASPLG